MTEADKDKSENSFKGWSNIIKDMPLSSREPIWDQAIKYLVSEGAMEPTMYNTLTQGQIQNIILENDRPGWTIWTLLHEFGTWIHKMCKESVSHLNLDKGNEIWLAYLMAVYYAMEWDGEKWINIGENKT